MSKILWLIGGVAAGVILAHQLNKTEQGQQFFSNLDTKAKEFGTVVSEQYKAREADLRAAVANVESAIQDFSNKSK